MDEGINDPVKVNNSWTLKSLLKNYNYRDFLGGQLVKTPCFQCRGCGFDPWYNLTLHWDIKNIFLLLHSVCCEASYYILVICRVIRIEERKFDPLNIYFSNCVMPN